MINHATPRQVLREITEAKEQPWWARRLGHRIEMHLGRTMWQGKPLIDCMLTEAQCKAVIDEALIVVRAPDPRDPLGEMLRDAKAMGHG